MSTPRRTKHFIDANVQGALARRIIIHWVLFLTVASVVAFLLQVLSNPFQPISEHLRGLWQTHGVYMLVFVFLLPVFVVDSIKLSHRFAGPIFAMRRAIREIAHGQPPRKLKFRRRDFWHGLAEDYNAMLRRLEVLPQEGKQETSDDKLVASKR
jgi:nitrogen fixation/metabolism regulation signal transduction histidine kinase